MTLRWIGGIVILGILAVLIIFYLWRGMVRIESGRSLGSAMSTTAAILSSHGARDHPTGWRRYVYSTNHKDIGTMYLVLAITAGVIGGVLSILIRIELQEPGLQVFSNPHYFNVVVSAHGLRGDAAPVAYPLLALLCLLIGGRTDARDEDRRC